MSIVTQNSANPLLSQDSITSYYNSLFSYVKAYHQQIQEKLMHFLHHHVPMVI